MKTIIRQRIAFWTIMSAIAAAVYGALSLIAMSVAHAEPAVAGSWHDAEPAALAGTTATWLLGALVALRAIEMGLKWLAPRTETKIDDNVYAVVHGIRQTAEEILTHVKPTDAPLPPPGPVPTRPQGGFVSMWPLVIMAGTTVGIASQAMWFGGCAETKRGANAAKIAALKCAEPQFATAAAIVARWAVEDALAGKVQWAQHETDALGVGTGVGTCAYAEFLRAWKARPMPQALVLGAPPDDGSASLERLRAKLGGAKIELPDGTIL